MYLPPVFVCTGWKLVPKGGWVGVGVGGRGMGYYWAKNSPFNGVPSLECSST